MDKYLKFRENNKNMDDAYRTRWSCQGCINKLIVISIVIYVLKQSGIGGQAFLEFEIILFKTPSIQYRLRYRVV